MLNSRENFMRIFQHQMPEFVPADGPYDMIFSPAEHYRDSHEAGAVGLDWFGVSWTYTEPFLAVPTPGVYRLESIEDWEAENVIPDAAKIESFDWEKYCKGFTDRWNREERISVAMISSGFFERMHHLLGFEEALVSFYTAPEEIHDFLDALLEFKKHTIRKIYEYAHPDIILFMDDYGNAKNLFFSKEMWDEFFAPRLKKIIDYVHELGMIFEMHSCGYIQPLIADMVEMGIDILQPLQAMNDMQYVKKNFGDRIVLHGGITASEMMEDPLMAREKVRECVRCMAPGGNFIPLLSECFEKREFVSGLFREELKEIGFDYQ